MLTWYGECRPDFQVAAGRVRDAVQQRLKDASIELHTVEARAKSIDSLARKLRKKNYEHPLDSTTDLVGIRVITLFRNEVDAAVSVLRGVLTIDEAHSVDKRHQLAMHEFGYRSVHLVGPIDSVEGAILPDAVVPHRVEIQVRSVLEHAWAEMEHELVYKTGTNYVHEVRRNISAVAGALELMDLLFEDFRAAFNAEVETRLRLLSEDHNGLWEAELDAANLVAALEILVGTETGWRSSAGAAFPPHSSALLADALKTSGVYSAAALRDALSSSAVSERVQDFAALSGVALDEVSHLALAALVAGVQEDFEPSDFPDVYADSVLLQALSGDAD